MSFFSHGGGVSLHNHSMMLIKIRGFGVKNSQRFGGLATNIITRYLRTSFTPDNDDVADSAGCLERGAIGTSDAKAGGMDAAVKFVTIK